MNGHEAILNLRRNRMKPAYVWLQDSGLAPNDMAITLSPTDNPAALDLRCLIGTTVLAESQDKRRLSAMLKACMEAKASRVIATLYQRNEYGVEITETTDTDKVMTWHK